MALYPEDTQYIQELVNANIVTASMLNSVPITIDNLIDMLKFLAYNIDENLYTAFGLQQSSQYIYIPGNAFDDRLIGGTITRDVFLKLLYEYSVFPLKQVGNTLWMGVIRPYPIKMDEITTLIQHTNIGWTIITPKALIRYMDEFREKGII